jgi:hypothetical protein
MGRGAEKKKKKGRIGQIQIESTEEYVKKENKT